MPRLRTFLIGFGIGLFIFILINLIAAHLLSDCGLPAVFGLDHCADDIARAGFPFIFFEEGGFDYRNIFNTSNLVNDIVIAILFSIGLSFVFTRYKKS
ncbi:MAG: hypothetical protein JNM46_07000 [Anaerolineales bacterium]|nr:hypothetical protein [Anaerolineales bacterium]